MTVALGIAFGATLLVECTCALALARARGAVQALAALNAITFPFAVVAAAHGASWPGVELGVAAAEAVGLRGLTGLSLTRAAALSAVANGVTAGLALWLPAGVFG